MNDSNTTSNDSIETTNQEQDNMETEEQQLSADAGESTEGAIEEVEAPKEKAVPAHLAFVAASKAHADLLGLSQKDQKGFFQVWNATTGHKLYIAKQGRSVTRIDTTLPMSALDGICLPLDKPNGRIACHVQPTTEAVALALEVLASYSDKIPSPKRPAKADAVVEAPAAE